ncbi:hypothetical protein NQ314_011799 [Rhamnusium bicolor]|uniref:DDE Tnp4 domain-containing protein n=1 Tax=Rhamnusium bicolor TaxID=1586634 RepID=A0AAV8XG79_9CUCU|nr:hypothetical protein NQ314_011799 [Rhamnusium bicolor]
MGDSGYPLRTWLMTPSEDEPVESTPEYFYNKKPKSIRSTTERGNDVLKMIFRCLLKHLHHALGNASKIINACVVLHNLCIEYNITEPDQYGHIGEDFGMYARSIVNDNVDIFHRTNLELALGRRPRLTIRNLRQD